jgi:nucleoid-associated protein YgaU
VRQQFTFFSPTGTPLRAKLTVELREYKSLAEQIRELNLKSADHTKAHVVVEGETISSVAYKAYGDPAAWRSIAEANAIEDPLGLAPGTILRIPRGET